MYIQQVINKLGNEGRGRFKSKSKDSSGNNLLLRLVENKELEYTIKELLDIGGNSYVKYNR